MIHQSQFAPLVYPRVSLATLLQDAMAPRGDRIALIDGVTDRSLSYRDILDHAQRIAGALQARGFEPGQVVAIVSPNVLEYPETLLGIWIAGGIATPINPMATTEELTGHFGLARARFAVTVGPLAAKVAQAGRDSAVEELFVIGPASVGTPFARLYEADPVTTPVPVDPATSLAALPWSSGTSGKPKAVMLTHENLVAQLHQFAMVQQHEVDTVNVGVLPFFHIYGLVLILLYSLWHGLRLVVLGRFELESFLSAISRYRVTLAPVVPPIIVQLAKHPLVEQYDLSQLRYVMSGAAPLGAEVEAACASRLRCLVIQGYGMTELTGASHLHPLDHDRVRRGSGGLLVPGIEARIVDPATGESAGIGSRGELWLRGPNVMSGYLENPDATAATLDDQGWLRTGDIGYVDDQGYYYIVDRLKELIKYNGHQVAPADLEAVLLSHPSIAEAAVIPSPCPIAGEVPKAFIVLRAPLTAHDVMEFVASRVSPLEKVRRVQFVEQVPKSPSGKILRRILVAQERAAAAVG